MASRTSIVLSSADAMQRQDQDTLSADDLAWADSCLIKDPEISETNLDSLKDVILDILSQHPDILGSSANGRGGLNDRMDLEILPSVTEEEEEEEEDFSHTAESVDGHEEKGNPDNVFMLKKAFLPTYKDEMINIQYSDSDSDEDFASPKFVMEPPGDIFRVWDLDIPAEEDELVKQLNEALSESSSNTITRDPRKVKGFGVGSLDTLVESIADLSLQ